MHTSDHIIFFHGLGDFFYVSLYRMCSNDETKDEYDKSNAILADILLEEATLEAVGVDCVEAMTLLQSKLKRKEKHLAHYKRMGITMCLDAMTTSPVESMNQLTKHGPMGANANMNLSKSIMTMTNAHDTRIKDHHHKATRSVGMVNLSSNGPTKYDVHHKCQYMLDQNFDRGKKVNYVRMSDEEWIGFNLCKETIEEESRQGIWRRLARYHQVRHMKVKRMGNQLFLHCSCQFHDR